MKHKDKRKKQKFNDEECHMLDENKNALVSRVPSKLKTPSVLGDKAQLAISEVLNPLIADCFALFVKTKNYHWHLSGRHYRDYHLLFDEQADQIFAMIDVLAERVRKIGGSTIHSISQISRLQHIQDDDELFVESLEMLRRLLNDNQELTIRLREAHHICANYKDYGTTNILEAFIDETERRTWFLFETQIGG